MSCGKGCGQFHSLLAHLPSPERSRDPPCVLLIATSVQPGFPGRSSTYPLDTTPNAPRPMIFWILTFFDRSPHSSFAFSPDRRRLLAALSSVSSDSWGLEAQGAGMNEYSLNQPHFPRTYTYDHINYTQGKPTYSLWSPGIFSDEIRRSQLVISPQKNTCPFHIQSDLVEGRDGKRKTPRNSAQHAQTSALIILFWYEFVKYKANIRGGGGGGGRGRETQGTPCTGSPSNNTLCASPCQKSQNDYSSD